MQLKMPYGKDSVGLRVEVPYTVLVPNEFEVADEQLTLSKAINAPLGQGSLEAFVEQSRRLLVIVNDASRPTPTKTVLSEISDILRSHPDLEFLVATGAHRAPTPEEYTYIFGDLYEEFKSKIFAHDARKDSDMAYLGRSKRGTEIYLNKMVKEANGIIVIGSVEPHYFAGYTGGRKAFLPGVASYKTIEMNHKHALSAEAKSLALAGNPVHDDMADAMALLSGIRVFSIQTVLTGDHRIYAATAGDLTASFDAAIEKANEIFCVRCERKGNIVVTAAPYPMDIDLYQSQKALENGKLALEEGGVIILLSKCRMGVGEDAFLKLLSSAKDCKDVMAKIERGYKLGYHKAAKLAEIGTWACVWAVTDLPPKTITEAKIVPKAGLQEAFDEAVALIRSQGKKPYAVIMPQGSLTVPLIKGGGGKGGGRG